MHVPQLIRYFGLTIIYGTMYINNYYYFSQLILCEEYTRAEDHDWHLDHFCCLRCDLSLGGKQYRPQEGMPFCLNCYEIAFSAVCEVWHCVNLFIFVIVHDQYYYDINLCIGFIICDLL